MSDQDGACTINESAAGTRIVSAFPFASKGLDAIFDL